MLHLICQQIWKTQQWPQDWKRSVFIPVPKKGNAKECSNYCTNAIISQASKVMLKILQARLQQYVIWELPDVQAGFRKGRGIRDQIAIIHWIIKKAREFQENIYFCFIDYNKAFDCVDQNKVSVLSPHLTLTIAEAWLWEFWAIFTSVWDECICAVVWTFFGIAFLWDWKENWPFPVL